MANDIQDHRFFYGGNAIFTVSSKDEHYTYRISKKKDERSPLFIGLLTGPDNEKNYTYMGCLLNDGTVKLTVNSKFKSDSLPVLVLEWAIRKVWKKEILPAGYAVQHKGKCCVCGRTLTLPESINAGIGPSCSKGFFG